MVANSVILPTVASRPPFALPHSADAGAREFDPQHSVQDVSGIGKEVVPRS